MNRIQAIIFGLIIIFASSAVNAEPQPLGNFLNKNGAVLPANCTTKAELAAGMGSAFYAIYKALAAIVTTIVPHLGYLVEDDAGAIIISWPLQWSFGTVTGRNALPASGCPSVRSREEFNAHRIVLEPQILAFTHRPDGAKPFFGFRPAYRFVYHAKGSKLGYGIGVGGQFTLEGDAGFKSSLSPEILFQYGDCCGPGFLDLSLRYDYTFSDDSHGVSVLFGMSYF